MMARSRPRHKKGRAGKEVWMEGGRQNVVEILFLVSVGWPNFQAEINHQGDI